MRNLVSIIIINWNGLKWLPDCFGSLAKQDYRNYEIVFVDNASKDESVLWVRMHYPKAKIIPNSRNLGFANANNIGYRHAKGEYVLFLNNDTKVTTTFLRELVKLMESDQTIGCVQSKILLMDHPDTHDSVGAFLTPTGFLYHYGFGKKDQKKYDKEINLYTAKGACMMFRRDVLEKIMVEGKVFDPDYFAYFEETDLCHRVWLAGYRVVYAPKSVIYHKMGGTSSGMNNAFIQYHSFKNRIRTYIKNFGTQWMWTYLPFHLIISQLYALVSFVRGNWALGWAIERAYWWNIQQFSKTMSLRRYIQRNIRIVSDSELKKSIIAHPTFAYYMHLLSGNVISYEEK